MTFHLPSTAATQSLAEALAAVADKGDVIALQGNLGAGKTTFARYFVQALGVDEEVPSPTFTLVQTYPLIDHSAEAIWHFDLYRIDNPLDAYELNIEDAFDTGISLIEWPEKLGDLMPQQRLEIQLAFGEAEGTRTATLDAPADWAPRLANVTAQLSDLLV